MNKVGSCQRFYLRLVIFRQRFIILVLYLFLAVLSHLHGNVLIHLFFGVFGKLLVVGFLLLAERNTQAQAIFLQIRRHHPVDGVFVA